MKIIVKGSFYRDVSKVRNKGLLAQVDNKITQIEKADGISRITGLKLLKGYSHHYRIIVKYEKYSYRIGAIPGKRKSGLFDFFPEELYTKIFLKMSAGPASNFLIAV